MPNYEEYTMKKILTSAIIAVAAVTQSDIAAGSQLIEWNSGTLYSQTQATDTFSDSVRFNVDSGGNVGVAVSFRTWTFTGTTTIAQFSGSLIDDSTNTAIAANSGQFFPNIGGTYFINPMTLQAGTYTANVALQVKGFGLLEVDVLSITPPYATLSPVASVPELPEYALMVAGIAAISILFSPHSRRVAA